MPLVKKTVELDQEQINRIKTALKARSEKEAINAVLKTIRYGPDDCGGDPEGRGKF